MAYSAATPVSGLGDTLAETFYPDVETKLNLFAIHRRRVAGNWSYPQHEHPQYEINYLLAGCQAMTVNGREYVQRAGDLLLLRPGDAHASRSGDGTPFEYFCIHFDLDDELLLSLLGGLGQVFFPASGLTARKVKPVLHKILTPDSEGAPNTVAGRLRLQAAVFELFAQLWEAISAETELLPKRLYGKVELAHAIAGRLKSAGLIQHGGTTDEERFGIGPIAAELRISVSHCNRVFRKVYAVSPRVYWSELLLNKSRLLLATSAYSIQAIAEMLGYRDIAHFSRQFKRWTGLSPSEYRKRLKPQDDTL